MNCTNCGSSLVSGAKFCENCGMGATAPVAAAPQEPAKVEKAPEKSAQKSVTPSKMIPKWFIITAMVLSILTALGIAGYFVPALKTYMDQFTYAVIFASALVGVSTLFYLFCLIYFLAKRFGHGSKIIPVLHFILYAIGGGVIGALSSKFYQSQIGLALLILCSAVSFIVLCVCLYFLLREKPQE